MHISIKWWNYNCYYLGYITQLNEFEKWRKNNVNIDGNIQNEDNYVDEISHQPLNQDYESIFRNATDLFGDDDNSNNNNNNIQQ